jgi:hypothetical protein
VGVVEGVEVPDIKLEVLVAVNANDNDVDELGDNDEYSSS